MHWEPATMHFLYCFKTSQYQHISQCMVTACYCYEGQDCQYSKCTVGVYTGVFIMTYQWMLWFSYQCSCFVFGWQWVQFMAGYPAHIPHYLYATVWTVKTHHGHFLCIASKFIIQNQLPVWDHLTYAFKTACLNKVRCLQSRGSTSTLTNIAMGIRMCIIVMWFLCTQWGHASLTISSPEHFWNLVLEI